MSLMHGQGEGELSLPRFFPARLARGPVGRARLREWRELDAPECASGFSRVDVYWPWWGPLVYGITFGIVAPIRAEYVCAERGGW